jgi:hypothetical protein
MSASHGDQDRSDFQKTSHLNHLSNSSFKISNSFQFSGPHTTAYLMTIKLTHAWPPSSIIQGESVHNTPLNPILLRTLHPSSSGVFQFTQGMSSFAAWVSPSSGILVVDGRKHNFLLMDWSPTVL